MKLTKDNVLSLVSEEEILERYLGIPVRYGKSYKNPLRVDNSPDCYFIQGTQRIFFQDYAQPYYGGDCFRICALRHNLRIPEDFFEVLRIINKDFKLGLEDGHLLTYTPVERLPLIKKKEINFKEKASIKARVKSFDSTDLEYWGNYYITQQQLEKHKVFRAEKVWINDSPFYTYTPEPCYVYLFPDDTMEVYRPFKISLKWRTNSNYTQGYNLLPETGDTLIITKSLKDIMVLDTLGYNAISPPAEGHPIREIESLKERFNNIYVFYDNDIAGVRSSIKLTSMYELDYINIPKEFEEKDPSDFVKKYGLDALEQLIQSKL
jgi:hypothetical protein